MRLTDEYYAAQLKENRYSLLGQLNIEDKAYSELLSYTRQRVRYLQTRSVIPADLLLSVTMVQIAVRRYYEGR